ncbi:hypothetical protein GCM10009609_51020 [Pseudonocardia aurantiaca]|uniref:DUF6412 domain-containing protein n=1 Tax=Pseudonocardia aurantiaca TaxID=75290 RepID=A0ABW4FVN0_9PSEU
MTGIAARAHGPLLPTPVGGRAAMIRGLVVVAALSAISTAALMSQPSPLLVGALGVLLCAFALARAATVVLPVAGAYGPVVAARDHHRALARRAVPRLRDPDAPGRTRSRAPSVLLPAAP